MPSTVNGIGTHYYGRKNVQTRLGSCQHCGRGVQLTSYDTRLWFVVVFIPILPLGRKRIVDYCPACTRHYSLELDKWEAAKQLEISGALEKYRTDPTPEAAMAAHQQLLNFHQPEQAAEFRKMMREKYADNGKVQAYLGLALEAQGLIKEAEDCFKHAFELRPDLPEARVGVAESYIRAGWLDGARKLLDFLEQPGAAQLHSLAPLETLAIAFQNANRHAEALELFGKLQSGLPKIAEVKSFRDLVKKSEKALGKQASLLPKQKFSWKRFLGIGQPRVTAAAGSQVTWRGLAVVGVIVGMVLLGFVISNEYIRRHRTLHLVNGFTQPATIEIQGGESVRNFRGVSELVLKEGQYHATLSGPVREEVDFEIRSGYFDRWFSDPAWVLNVGGASVLVEQQAVYARNPPSPTITFHFGNTFQRFSKVTHLFTPLPESLRMKEHESRTLVGLELYHGEGDDLFNYFLGRSQPEESLRFAESWLRAHPDEQNLLQLFTYFGGRQKQAARVEAYLKTGLDAHPVRIEWHRAYQQLLDHPERRAELKAEYARRLAAEPTNSALLYLCGRVAGNRDEALRLFERSTTADPDNAFPVFALGYDRLAAGDWAGARPRLAKAVELAPKNNAFAQTLFLARLGLGENEALVTELRERLKREPLDYVSEVQLLNALAALGRAAEALASVTNYFNAFQRQASGADLTLLDPLRRHAWYAVGDFAALEKAVANDSTPEGIADRMAALIEQGKPEEAAALPQPAEDTQARLELALALAVSFGRAGNTTEAARWRSTAIEALKQYDEDYERAASLLEHSALPSLAEVTGIIMPPSPKAVYVVALAQKHPQAAAGLLPLARALNVERSFPYHLVQRLTAAAP